MKTLILNASPRKDWNTARLLRQAEQGAREAGADVEYVDLYDLSFTGCHSCLLCKLKDARRCHCFWKDDLSPLIDKAFAADALIIGTPIYFGDVTSQFHALSERLRFVALSYDDFGSYFEGAVNLGVILTMNVAPERYEGEYKGKLAGQFDGIARFLNGDVRVLPVCDTLQVDDYSKYAMNGFDRARKHEGRKVRFPQELEAARLMGAELSA
ncbi:MAG: flavodoxin family protein [Coriobacteriales bacterium]